MGLNLVTGGGGFIGRHIVRQLIDRGESVRVLGRRRYDFLPNAVEQIAGDVAEPSTAESAVAGVDCIYHVAAMTGVGRPWEMIRRTNVAATNRLLHAATNASVGRFVFTSSPSVVFGQRGHADADESLPYPTTFLDTYAQSKAEAEQRVLGFAADRAGELGGFSLRDQPLRTVAIRPHLVFGPEDQSLMPRVVDRARSGRLRIVGDGTNPISVAYVENVAAAHLQAADELAGEAKCDGKAYFVNEPQPVQAKDWINTLLAMAGEPPCERHVPAGVAYAAGAVLEQVWPWLSKEEPPMTRFIARQLSEPHSFRIDAARADFGYTPVVSWDEALTRTGDWAKTAFASDGKGAAT